MCFQFPKGRRVRSGVAGRRRTDDLNSKRGQRRATGKPFEHQAVRVAASHRTRGPGHRPAEQLRHPRKPFVIDFAEFPDATLALLSESERQINLNTLVYKHLNSFSNEPAWGKFKCHGANVSRDLSIRAREITITLRATIPNSPESVPSPW